MVNATISHNSKRKFGINAHSGIVFLDFDTLHKGDLQLERLRIDYGYLLYLSLSFPWEV